MCTLVTKEAPNFAAQAVMPDGSFAELKLSSYRGKYVVLFFYPLDFTFVCPRRSSPSTPRWRSSSKKNAEVLGVLGRFAFHAPGLEEHAAQSGRHRPDPISRWSPTSRSRLPRTTASCWRRAAWPCAGCS